MEKLEERSCPSVFYDFNVIAKTGDLGMTGMQDSPSINDQGQVAFVGNFSDGSGLIVGDGTPGSLENINPTLSHESSRSFGRFAQINNSGQVLAIDHVSGSPGEYRLRTWDSSTPGSNSIIASGGGSFLDSFDALLRRPSH